MKHIICILITVSCSFSYANGFISSGYYNDIVKKVDQCKFNQTMFYVAENEALKSAQKLCGSATARQTSRFTYRTSCEYSVWGNLYFLGVEAKAFFFCE